MTRQLPTCLRARLTLLTRPHLLPLPMLRRVNLFMNDNKYALQMQDITVEFPGVLANDHVSIDCKKGEVLGLLGENGAGKTTLMNVLYGLYPPSSGKILLDGREAIKLVIHTGNGLMTVRSTFIRYFIPDEENDRMIELSRQFLAGVEDEKDLEAYQMFVESLQWDD